MMAIRSITFDCYGTLIDWESGARRFFEKILAEKGADIDSLDFFDCWEEIQFEMIKGRYRPYKEILRDSLATALESFDLTYDLSDGDRFVADIGRWPPFQDVPEALRRLKTKYRIGIISNIDEDIIARTLQLIGANFDAVITAESARAYKPSTIPFYAALQALRLEPEEILHAAFGFKYDIVPASKLGFKTAYVNRYDQPVPEGARPDLVVTGLDQLAAMLAV